VYRLVASDDNAVLHQPDANKGKDIGPGAGKAGENENSASHDGKCRYDTERGTIAAVSEEFRQAFLKRGFTQAVHISGRSIVGARFHRRHNSTGLRRLGSSRHVT